MTRASNNSSFAKQSHPLAKFSRQIFSVHRRDNRTKFWLAYLVGLALLVAAVGILFESGFPTTPKLLVAGTLGVLGIAIHVLAGIRRLHDRDMSGHWLWLFYLAPRLIGRFASGLADVAESDGELTIAGMCALIAAGLFICGLVEMGFRRGTPGPNRYGPDPLQHKQEFTNAERA